MFFSTFTAITSLAVVVSASPTPTTKNLVARAPSCDFPTPPSTSSLSEASVISGSFDGGNVRYDRGTGACNEQAEGDEGDAVFILEDGATLSNVVIGADQAEGVHCRGSCTILNVWFEDVCEDAVSVKGPGTATIRGGGARHADDKVIQHNGAGNVIIEDYCVQDFGKLYRSCGNCSNMPTRTVEIRNIIAEDGDTIAGINSNFDDVATIDADSLQLSGVSSVCDTYEGKIGSGEPDRLTRNESNDFCRF